MDSNQQCTDQHFAAISAWIVDWRDISPLLGLTEADDFEIQSVSHSVKSKKMAMLRKWRQKLGAEATCEKLSQIMRQNDIVDIAEKIQNLQKFSFNEEGSSSNFHDPLTSYASNLKELYTSMSHSHTSQHWAHLPRCEFIQLAMIKGEEMRRGGPEEEMIRLAQMGKIETILHHHKEPIHLHNLIPSSEPAQRSVCLVEGAPGGGKSTLALHICHQWAKGTSWLVRFDVVILAYLREEAIQNANTLADILPAHGKEMQKIVSRIEDTKGRNVLFIFDGWDEFPRKKMNNSFVSKLLRKPYCYSLHHSTILITSRPVASLNLHRIVDQRVEILGFTQHQIRGYIEKALDGNSTRIQKLFKHLEEHPVIEGYCYLPLHVAILVHVFLTMKGALPTTLHELFCDLVLCCIVREQETRETDTCLPEVHTLDDLPHKIKSNLNNLSVLAYNGVKQDKIVFSSQDLKAEQLPKDLPSLGLLQAVEGLTLTSKSWSHNFLHLSVQELLAAYCILQKDASEQVKIFKEFLLGSPRLQAVLHYYSGFTKLGNEEIQQYISHYQDDKFSLKELLLLLNYFFEAQRSSLCKLVHSRFYSRENQMWNAKHLSPVDFLAIGYFITSLLSTPTTDEPTVYLKIEQIDEHSLHLLLNELTKSFSVEGRMHCERKLVVHLDKPCVTGKGVKNVLATHLKQSLVISELVLSNGNIQCDEDGLLHIAELLRINTSLTKLCLYDMKLIFNETNTFAINDMFKVNKSLSHLDFSGNNNTFLRGHHHIERPISNTTLLYLKLYKPL